jgi:hypothetical protein
MKKVLDFLRMGTLMCVFGVSVVACTNEPLPSAPETPEDAGEIKTSAGISDNDFCQYLDLENIHKTIPLVNLYINNMPQDWDYTQRAQSLVAFFNSFTGVTGSRFVPDEYEHPNAVFFSFMDGSTNRELALDFSSTHHVISYHYDVVVGAWVHTKRYVTIEQVFDFINSLDMEANEINGYYVSNLPPSEDELQRVIDGLNAKPYTHDETWSTGGYLHYKTKQIYIFPHLFDMHNREYQADWLEAMSEYELTETFEHESDGHVVKFAIPENATIPESHWQEIFAQYDFLEWAEMSHNRYTLADETMGGGHDNGNVAVDSKIHIRPRENDTTSPRTLQLLCLTERAYSSGSNPIIVNKEQSANTIDISFKGVAEIGMTCDVGPAKAYIDLGALAVGTYNLNLYNGDVMVTARLVVTAQNYTIEMANNDTFAVSPSTLNRE